MPPEPKLQLALDMGGTRVKAALVSGGSILAQRDIDSDSDSAIRGRLPAIERLVAEMLQQSNTNPGSVRGIGIAFAGPVDARTGRVLATNAKFDDAPNVDLLEWARLRWNAPALIDNDARLACLGEWAYGAAKGSRSVVTVTLGTGIGTGVIIEGRLLRGTHSQAGSLGGHFPIDIANKPVCTCGNSGCAEAVASTWAFRRDLATLPESRRRLVTAGKSPEECGLRDLFSAAADGNPDAKEMAARYTEAWGALAVALIHAYDPEVVVLVGGVLAAGDAVTGPIERYARAHAWTPGRTVPVVAGRFPAAASLIGAAYLASGAAIDVL